MKLREANRIAKLRQLCASKPVKAELALRWWHSNNSYLCFSTIVLHTYVSKSLAFASEHTLISKWQPPLNFPFAIMFLKKKALGYSFHHRVPTQCRSNLGSRLFKRIRRRHGTIGRKRIPMSHTVAWKLLSSLASLTKASYCASRVVRSLAVSPEELYGLYRLGGYLEEPMRSRARTLLSQAMKFRKLNVPRKNKALILPFLASPSFKRDILLFLKQFVQRHKRFAIPLHLPTCKPVEGSHQKIADCLFNYKQWATQVQDLKDLRSVCTCAKVPFLTNAVTWYGGHIASSASTFRLPPDIVSLLKSHVQSSFYSSKHVYLRKVHTAFEAWLKHHGLPMCAVPELVAYVSELWPQHLTCAKHESRFTSKQVFFAKSQLETFFVIHCADKESGHAMCYCPALYFSTMRNTWNDPAVFERVKDTPTNVSHSFRSLLSTTLAKRYAWGLRWSAPLPYGYGFLKRKKNFQVARTIISYYNTLWETPFPCLVLRSDRSPGKNLAAVFGATKTACNMGLPSSLPRPKSIRCCGG